MGDSKAVSIVAFGPEHAAGAHGVEVLSFSRPWSEQAFYEELKKESALMLAAVDRSGRVVGWAGLEQLFGEGAITNIAVTPQYRRQGIGWELLKELLDRARRLGVLSVTLEVRETNAAAIALYRQLGFEELGVRRGVYDRPVEDAVVMGRQL